MARSKTSDRKPNAPDARPARRVMVRIALAAVVLAGVGFGYSRLSKLIERRFLFPGDSPRVVLQNRPVWMTDLLADQIIRAARPSTANSALDRVLIETVAGNLAKNPWVKKVNRVRRAFGEKPGDTIEIDCEYRQPMALVHYGIDYYLIDEEGVLLPEKFSAGDVPQIMFSGEGAQRQINIRVIEAVKSPRPVEPGERWQGGDLAAGLGIVKLLYGQPYADEIWRVDVNNFQGRVSNSEAQIVLKTSYNTEIRWGEPRDALFHIEVAPVEKLNRLRAIKQQYGRVDAKYSWIDIRYDKVNIPAAEVQQARGQ